MVEKKTKMMYEDYNAFVKEIKRKIINSGIPAYKVAPLMGISESSLIRFLKGNMVSFYTLQQIAKYYNIDVVFRQN